MALERQSIEKKDFPIGRRGYDPEAVDAHLSSLADEVDEFKRASRRRSETLASAASDQVRAIVEAAENSAAEIQRQAEDEAQEIRTEASSEAQATREQATGQARDYVGKVSESTAVMLQRLDAMEHELSALIDSLRTGSNRLNADLQLLEGNLTDVKEAVEPRPRFEPEPAAPEAAAPEVASFGVAEPAPAPAEPDPAAQYGYAFDPAPPAAPAAPAAEEAPPAAPEPAGGYGESTGYADPAAYAEPAAAAEPEPPVDTGADAHGLPSVDDEPPASYGEAATHADTASYGETPAYADTPSYGEQPAAAHDAAPAPDAAATSDDTEGARLIALNMALNGTPREETDRYLAENFQLADRAKLLDEVYASVEG